MSRRDLYVYGDPVDATGVTVRTNVAAGPSIETHFGSSWPLRLQVPLTWTVDAFIGETIGGRSTPTFGAIRCENADGALDAWLSRVWDGRPLTIVASTSAGDDFLAIGMAEQPTTDGATITLPFRDPGVLFDQPVQPHLYLGTGTYEGELELKGTPRPLLLGYAEQFEPTALNVAQRIYQLHDGKLVYGSVVVRERGLVFDTMIAVSDVFTWDTSGHAGAVAVDYDRGLIRFASPTTGLITCSAQAQVVTSYEGLTATHANLVHTALHQSAIAVGFDVVSRVALNTAVPYAQCGMHLREVTSIGAVLDRIATSCGAYWTLDRLLGFVRMRQIGWSASVGVLTPTQLVAPAAMPSAPLPPSLVKYVYHRRHRVLSATDIGAAALDDVTRAAVTQEANRWVTGEQAFRDLDPSFVWDQSRHRLAQPIEIESIFHAAAGGSANAAAEALRQIKLMQWDRLRPTLTVWGAFGRYRLGDTVTVQSPRYGLDAGKDFLVLGLDESVALDSEADRTTLRLWGPKAVGE